MIKKLMTARRFITTGVLSAFMFIGVASVNAQAPPAPDNGWIFSEQDGETAEPTFGGAAGTLSGGVEWSTEDPLGGGGSVSFDGVDGTVVMEDLAEAFNDLSNFSLSLWIKANDTGIDRGFWEAVDSGGGDLWGLRYDSTGATAGGSDVIKLGITTSESGGNTNLGGDQQESHEGTQTTEWQHIVMTWEDGEGFNLYIDGELDEPTLAMVSTGGTTALMDRFVLGDGAKAYWDGLIDEVAVWKSTLTADNAAWLAENSIAGLGVGGGSSLLTGLTGYWPLEAGSGTTAANSAGGEDAELYNGVEWVDDPDRGAVLSFDGVDAYGDAGAETIPQMTQDNDFTWSVWINQGGGNGPNNVVLGNRYGPEGTDFAPREFIKFTPTQFELHLDGAPQNCEYDDLANSEGEWVHYVVVKTGDTLTHYSNGEVGESSTFTSELQNPQPLYFGGDKAAENWNGMLDDIAIWDRALSASEVSALHSGGIPTTNPLLRGLVAHFPLDSDGNSTNGEFTASTVTDVEFGSDGATGNTGTSATFNGTSSIIQHDWVAGLNPEDSFTLSLWAKSDGGAGAWHSPVTSRNDINPDSQGYIIYDNEPAGAWTFWSGNGTVDGNWQTMDGPEATMGEWEHLTIVYDSTEGEEMKRLYVNGELALEQNDIVAENDTKPFNIGAGGDTGTAYFFKGDIDDLALWSRALSASEVADVHANGIPKPGGSVETVPGLIAYWPFDGDLQDAVGDSHGEAMGSDDIAYGSGKLGQGIDLDGVDQFVQTPVENEEMFDFQDGTGFSISAWFSVNEFSKNWQALIAKGEGNRWRIHRRGGENILTGNGGNGDVPAGTPDINDGELHHIVLVSDPENDEVRLYSDGELASSNNGPAIQSNDNPMMIGENPDALNRTWSGMIDDVGIWDRPITEDEIATIWNGGDGTALVTAGGGVVELVPELIAYWPFDSASDLVDKVAGIEGEAQGTVDDAEGHLGGAVDFGAGNTENWIKVDAEANTWLAAASDNDALSVSFWQKLHVVKSSSTIWFRAEAAGANARNFQAHVPWGNNAIFFDTAGCCDGGTQRISKGAAEIDFLEWHHFVFVKDGENKSIWIDGELFHEGVNTTALFDDWTYFAIGSSGTDVFADAIVDDLGVWARGITADEVAAIYNGGAGAPLISAGTATPKPRLAGMTANGVGFSFQLKDVDGATVDPDSIVVNFDGADVEVTKSTAEGVTTVSYVSPELLASESVYIVKVSVKDTNGNSTRFEKEAKVKAYTLIDSSVTVADSMKGDSGFLVYATQISSGQGVGNVHGTVWLGAEKQINGEYIDPDTEEQYLNEADIDSFEGWSYYPEIVETVNQNQDAPGGVGNFQANDKGDSTDREDEPLTGIPGWGDSTDGIASEYIALLELEAGAYKLGVNSDDGFSATIGANFGDLLAQQIGLFAGGRGASSTEFEIIVEESGLYPYRVSWWEGGGGANIEIYSYVNGEKTLINDPDVEGSIKAYTIAGATVDESTLDRVTTGRAKVLSVSPAPGDTMVKSSEVVVTVQNEDTTVKQDTVVLSLNGEAVDASVSKSGDIVTISYSPDAIPVGTHTASLSFEESNGIARATEWSFTVPGLYVRSGDVPAEPMGLISVREYHGVGGTGIAQLMGAAKFPDSPDVSTFVSYFEWPASGDIEVPPASNVRDNYGTHMMGYIYPPETGEYIFALACDDNGQVWLSTDESPANAKLIASQGGWQPVRDYRAETTSSEIFLEAGQIYFIEAFVNEGGGGDNLAVAWSLPEDGPSDVEPGGLPISGDYLSPYFSVLDGEPSPILTSSGPVGAAVANTASISATFKNRGVAFTGVSVEVNGVAVEHTLAADGGITTITADPGGVKGLVDVTLSWNGESKSWSYFGHDALGDGPNPIGFWDFNLDLGNGTTIDNVYGLVGQLRNGAAFTDDSHEGTAMDMTDGGNQHVHVAAGEFLNIASSVNQVTVAFWQKNYSIPSTSSFWAEPQRAMQAHVPWSNGEIYWDTAGCCNGGTQRINANATDIGGWGEDMLDTWHHYVFVKNEDAKEIWIDGELFHDGDNTSPLPSDINYLNIGGDAAGNASLRGVIDDFAVFASALDEDQIMALAEGDRSILPAAPGYPILVSARSGGLPGLGSYYVQTVGAVPGPWAFKDDVWVSAGSVAGCGGPYHDFLTSPDYIVSADGEVSLSVDHRHAFEADMWDAGQLWISVNGGAYADVGKDAFSANGYKDKAIVGNGIAKGENGFGGTSAGYADGSYITTTANLGSFTAGDAISVRIVALYDDCATGTNPNWVVAGVSSDQMVASSVPGTANLEVVLIKRADALSGEKLSVNGTDVAAEVATDGNTITITGTAADLAPGTAVATVTYNGQSSSWTFTVPERAINNGDGTITYNAHLAWEWWDGIGGHQVQHLNNFINDARYPDSPDGATFAPSFNTRTALAGGFEGNGRDSYGGRMSGILTAPEDGTYRFFVASDDASVLRISTDTDPANAVQVAHEDGCCKNFTLDDGGLSGTVDLVAGNQYYMEAILKEGGGGDWMTVAWRKPSEDIDSVPGGNQEGIPGEYFTGTVKVPALSALSSSIGISAGNSMDPKATVTLNVTDGATTLDTASVVISLGGTALDSTAAEGTWSKSFSSVTQSGKTHSITAGTGAVEAGTEYTVSATFKDSAGETTTHEATFTIAVWETYALGTKAPATAAGSITAREYEGVGGTSIGAMLGHASFPDSPSLEADAGYFEWPQSGDIDVKPEGNVKDNYAVQMIGFLHPPATGDYQFAIAADDNAQLWLSTDENPINRQLIATEPQWNGVRAFAVGDRRGTVDSGTADERFENLSKFITLEAGKAYYIEGLMNEGGGGDNYAVAWTTADPIPNDALPISGEYLSPWIILDSRVDVSQAEDSVVPSSDNHPAGEHAGLAIDNDSSTKYLNFDGANDAPSGLTITTGGGVVTGLGLTSANDAPDRDPATFVLSGSNDGGATFTEIASGDVPAFSARFQRQEVDFDNSTDYTTYELVFPTTAGASTCCMQVAEIELLGTAAAGGDAPALSVVNNGDGTVTITFEGTLQAAPTVNGPWENVDAPSPLTIPADQAQQYGRAVAE